jgi:hypothetical protein
MMGTKIRNFAPVSDLSLEELVSQDNFYRHLDRKLDLSFVRDLVEDCYASSGRPSVDPVVFRASGASSSGSLNCAWRPDWCGVRNSTSTLPRSRPKPLIDSMRSRSLMEHGLEEHLADIFPEEVLQPVRKCNHTADHRFGISCSGRSSTLGGKCKAAPMDRWGRSPAAGGSSVGLQENGGSQGEHHRP